MPPWLDGVLVSGALGWAGWTIVRTLAPKRRAGRKTCASCPIAQAHDGAGKKVA
jgi:hypothetical protein